LADRRAGASAGRRDRSVTAAEPGLILEQPRIERMDYARDTGAAGLALVSEEPGLTMMPAESADKPQSIKRVLVVDDDPAMQRMVSDYLETHGMRVAVAANKFEMSRHLGTGSFNIVLLDLRLGQEDGLDLLRDLRGRSDLPVIITTGHRRDEVDRVVGLELGADDYVMKPFSLRELLARIRVVLRRVDISARPVQESGPVRSRFGQWTLDRRSRRLIQGDGSAVVLTKGEYALLLAFVDAPQRPLSREQLLQATRVHEDVFDRSIDVQILRLRRKLEADPSQPRVIVTERGIGYVFAMAVETD
jgi:two-component system OmpR family response regulator